MTATRILVNLQNVHKNEDHRPNPASFTQVSRCIDNDTHASHSVNYIKQLGRNIMLVKYLDCYGEVRILRYELFCVQKYKFSGQIADALPKYLYENECTYNKCTYNSIKL